MNRSGMGCAAALLLLCPARSAHAAPASPWQEQMSPDPMTDAKRYMMATVDKPNQASFAIECDPDGENAFFQSKLFLDDAEKGKIKVRFDDEKAEDETAFLSHDVALFRDPEKPPSRATEPSDKYAMERAGHAFLLELKERPHKRLRVRLVSFDGDVGDLDFDITGLQDRLAAMERKCRSVAKR